MKYLICAWAFVFCSLAGCGSAALQYAQGRYPDCKVTEAQRSSSATTVLIQCPGQDPKTETFTER